MQPDETPGGIRDSVVTSDVHHHYYQQPADSSQNEIPPAPPQTITEITQQDATDQQPDQIQPDPWGGQQPDHKQPEAVLMGNVSAQPSVLGQSGMMPGQVIMVQQPSGAAKVVGVFVIIWGCFGVLSGLSSIIDSMSYSSMAIPLVLAILGLGGSAASILGGYWMTNYERRGVQLVLITVLVGFISASASTLVLGDIMQEELENGNITQGEYDATQGFMAVLGGIMIAVSAVCYGICGLIVAIPLMSANGGLDDSSLFSSSSI